MSRDRDPRHSGLFRPQVFENQAERHLGGMLVPDLHGFRWVAIASIAIVGLLLLALFMGHFKRTAPGVGWLDYYPSSAGLTIESEGTVTKVWVAEGDTVNVGDPLLEYSNRQAASATGPLASRHLDNLQSEAAEIDRQIRLAKEYADATSRSIEAEIAAAEREHRSLMSTRQTVEARLAIAETRLARVEVALREGHVSAELADQRRDEHLQAKLALSEHDRRAETLLQAIEGLRAKRTERRIQDEQRISELEARRASLGSQIARAQLESSGVLLAPIAGSIRELSVVPGDGLTPQREIARIVPSDAVLVANVLLPARHAGLVSRGTTVRLTYTSFPVEKYGAYVGTVKDVSPTVYAPDRQRQLFPLSTGEPGFLVHVQLEAEEGRRVDIREFLRAGLTLDASFELGSRRVIEWLLEPLLREESAL